MDPERGTERLADASFLEELLRGRRTLVVGHGDPAPGQHLAKRLGAATVAMADAGGDGAIPRADRSLDALVVLGGFQDPALVDRLVVEARRVLAPGGILAVSWMDHARPSLESLVSGEPRAPSFTPADATRRLAASFGFVAVVARQPYLGFQYVSGIDNQGAVPLDTSLTVGGSEAPTGFIAIASDTTQPVGDLLVQVPYDRVVDRVQGWLRAATPAPQPVVASPPLRAAQTVARPRDGGNEVERLRVEINTLRDRAQAAIEESDRARGEARAARERASLVDAEVAKLRARVKGAPDPDSGVRTELEGRTRELEVRTRERDAARRDAEGAAGEAARALEAAARYERDVEFLEQRVATLEAELGAAREDREKAVVRTVAEAREESARAIETLRSEFDRALATAHKERDRAVEALARANEELATLREKADAAATADKRLADVQRRAEQTMKRLREAEQRISDLEAAKSAAERSAEDAWRRVKEAQDQAPADDVVPARDLVAAQSALADAIARAEAAEREHRTLREKVPETAPADPAQIAELEGALATVRAELDAARTRADEADARATSAQRTVADTKEALDALRAKAEGPDIEGLRSLLHQRETAMAEARERAEGAEARAARFASEAAEAMARLKTSEDALAERDAEVKKALSALDGLEVRAAREKELIAELKGEVARLTEGIASARDDLAIAKAKPERNVDARDLDAAIAAAGMAQAETGKAHAQADALREQLAHANNEMVRLLAESEKGSGQDKERERRIAELEGKLLEAKAQGESTGEIERRAVAMSQKLAMLEAELERAKDDVKQATAEARKYRAMAEAIDPPADRPAKA